MYQKAVSHANGKYFKNSTATKIRHYSDVTWASSPTTHFFQQRVEVNIKENIKSPHYCFFLCGEPPTPHNALIVKKSFHVMIKSQYSVSHLMLWNAVSIQHHRPSPTSYCCLIKHFQVSMPPFSSRNYTFDVRWMRDLHFIFTRKTAIYFLAYYTHAAEWCLFRKCKHGVVIFVHQTNLKIPAFTHGHSYLSKTRSYYFQAWFIRILFCTLRFHISACEGVKKWCFEWWNYTSWNSYGLRPKVSRLYIFLCQIKQKIVNSTTSSSFVTK